MKEYMTKNDIKEINNEEGVSISSSLFSGEDRIDREV